ncbi:MAG: MBOAT family protein [Prevotellaceae bacterium]|jgi:D-alanyl-lipoteichoic acid acyltransferase DltB (MBOAT superfamily)|nr:MBOAT family protein [Prevotellaceae bacterium]
MIAGFDPDKFLRLFVYDRDAPMIFNSGFFLFLFLAFLFVYIKLRKENSYRIVYVILFSYYFYYKSSGIYFLIMMFVTVWDFFAAREMHFTENRAKRKLLMALSITANLGMLCYFKYTNFFYEMYCGLTGHDFSPFDIFLPVGISFFTFQSMSYTIDVYRKQLTPLDNIRDFAFYISFFPQLVAGPIVRAKDFIPQIRKPLFVDNEMFGRGIFLIIAGLFKKAVLSDYISVNFTDRIFDNPNLYSGIENLFGLYGYALQIYCDFSGYSDMAIGIALLLGFRFNINFDSPYQSASITEFWRRWHISLSSWLRDYLYISLGGNRRGKIRTYINLIITMLLGGLWHGPSLRFICWGAIHGVGLAIHKWLMGLFPGMKSSGSKMKPVGRVLGTVFTFHFVCFSWIFFRAETFETATSMLKQIFTFFHPEIFVDLVKGYTTVFVAMIVGFVLHFTPKSMENKFISHIVRMPLIWKAVAVAVVIVFIMQIKSSDILAFIYFRF